MTEYDEDNSADEPLKVNDDVVTYCPLCEAVEDCTVLKVNGSVITLGCANNHKFTNQ